MKDSTTRNRYAVGTRQSAIRWFRFLSSLLIAIQLVACSKHPDTPVQAAKPPEPKNQTYRTIDGQSVISLVSSDELEIREGGQNIVCKYAKQDGKLRVVVNALGTTTAKYFNITPQGLVGEQGEIYYEPVTYQKITAQIELNSKLLKAVESDDSQTIEECIRHGAALETHDARGNVLVIAIDSGLTNAVKSLLKNGANPNGVVNADRSQWETALSHAIVRGRAQIVVLLLSSGARPNDQSPDGSTPLILAAGFRGQGWGQPGRTPEHDKIVSMLCEAKANLNAQDNDGYTPLGRSLQSGNLEAAKILVASGADRNFGKEKGLDAFTLASTDGDKREAIRTDAEREELTRLWAQYPKTILGVWKDQDGDLQEFSADETWTSHQRNGDSSTEQFGFFEHVLRTASWRAKIVTLTSSNFVFELSSGSTWTATRVPQSVLDAEREKVNKVRQMFVGRWRDVDGAEFTIKADGTLDGGGGEVMSGKWSSDGRRFTAATGTTWDIESINETSFHLRQSIFTWKATKIR